MSNSISSSLNMRTLKEAMADQEQFDQDETEIEEDDFDEPSVDLVEVPNQRSSPMDKAYRDMGELDQAVYEHSKSTDDVLATAKDAFDTIFAVAQSVPPEKSARLFEVAAQYLDLMNKSSESKVSAKHDRTKLSVALTKAQLQAGMIEDAVETGIKAHRNDILKAIMGGAQDAEFENKTDSEDDK